MPFSMFCPCLLGYGLVTVSQLPHLQKEGALTPYCIWLTPSFRPSSSCSKVEEINIRLLLGGNDSDSNSPNSIHCCITPHIQAVVQVHHGASRDSGTGRTHFLSFYPSSFWESLCPQKHCIRFRTMLVCISETPCHT